MEISTDDAVVGFYCVLYPSDIERNVYPPAIYNPGVMVCVGWMFSYTGVHSSGLKT
jgi:hypothetical protein